MQVGVSAAFMQVNICAANMWVTIFIVIMQVAASVAIMQAVFSAAYLQVTVSIVAIYVTVLSINFIFISLTPTFHKIDGKTFPGIISSLHFTTVNILPKLRDFVGRNYIQIG